MPKSLKEIGCGHEKGLIDTASIQAFTLKPALSSHSKRRPKIGYQDQLSLNAGLKYCRMLQGEHSAIPLTFIKLPFVFKTFVLSIFEWLPKTGFTVVMHLYDFVY